MAKISNNFGRNHLTDYLIPVINLMKKRVSHTEAFKEIALKLDVTYQTVNDRCARGIGINTQQFADLVKSGKIKQHLINKFPTELEILNKNL